MVEDGTVELSVNSGELDKGQRIAELEQALRDIKKHMEFSSPTGHKMTGAWAIANAALK